MANVHGVKQVPGCLYEFGRVGHFSSLSVSLSESNAAHMTAPTQVPATSTNKKLDVPKNSLLDYFVQLKTTEESLDANAPMTRLDYAISTCIDSVTRHLKDRSPEYYNTLVAQTKWAEVPWFLVPEHSLSMAQYATFVYTYVNMLFNPSIAIKVSLYAGAEPVAVPCTVADLNRTFGWLHTSVPKLGQFLRQLEPQWDGMDNTALSSMVTMLDRCKQRYVAYTEGEIRAALTKQFGPDFGKHRGAHAFETRVRAEHINTMRALLVATPTSIKKAAKKAGVPIFAMYVLSLELDDEYMRAQQKAEELTAAQPLPPIAEVRRLRLINPDDGNNPPKKV